MFVEELEKLTALLKELKTNHKKGIEDMEGNDGENMDDICVERDNIVDEMTNIVLK